jgi:SAM-dependent methyltransferase
VDEALEAAKEGAWREVAAIDAAYTRGELDDDGWHAANAALVVPAYLSAATAEGGSGHSGTPAEWEYSRGVVADAIERAGDFLDVGCANGLLMESVHRWTGSEPHGLDIAPELVELARRRYPQWAGRIHVGNAIDWRSERPFAYVRAALDYVPASRRPQLVAHLLSLCDRLIVGKFNEEAERHALEEAVASWGFTIAGRTERPHRREPRLAYRVFWIDA